LANDFINDFWPPFFAQGRWYDGPAAEEIHAVKEKRYFSFSEKAECPLPPYFTCTKMNTKQRKYLRKIENYEAFSRNDPRHLNSLIEQMLRDFTSENDLEAVTFLKTVRDHYLEKLFEETGILWGDSKAPIGFYCATRDVRIYNILDKLVSTFEWWQGLAVRQEWYRTVVVDAPSQIKEIAPPNFRITYDGKGETVHLDSYCMVYLVEGWERPSSHSKHSDNKKSGRATSTRRPPLEDLFHVVETHILPRESQSQKTARESPKSSCNSKWPNQKSRNLSIKAASKLKNIDQWCTQFRSDVAVKASAIPNLKRKNDFFEIEGKKLDSLREQYCPLLPIIQHKLLEAGGWDDVWIKRWRTVWDILEKYGSEKTHIRRHYYLFRPRQIPAKVRREVISRDCNRCTICKSNDSIEVDHILPFVKGGEHTAANLRVLCYSCHRIRHASVCAAQLPARIDTMNEAIEIDKRVISILRVFASRH